LAEARSLAERQDVVLRDREAATFFEQSKHAEAEARERELRLARRRQRILGGVAGVAALFAAAALVAAGFAITSQQATEIQREMAIVAQHDAEAARQEAENQRNAAQIAQGRAELQARVATS